MIRSGEVLEVVFSRLLVEYSKGARVEIESGVSAGIL